MIVYCHEYLSDRWSYHPYVDHLRDLGFDLFTFDFRNHGESDSEPGYAPMQWTTDREVRDLRAALEALRDAARSRSRRLRALRRQPRRNDGPRGGIDRARRLGRRHRRRVSDSRHDGPVHQALVRDVTCRIRTRAHAAPTVDLRHACQDRPLAHERRLQCRFPSVEAAAARLAPRPWFMIHGEADSYISPADRPGPLRRGARITKSSGWSRTRSTIAAARPTPSVTRRGWCAFLSDLLRVGHGWPRPATPQWFP